MQIVDDTAAALQGLHVFRSLGNYFDGRWRLGMWLLDERGAVAPLAQKDNSSLDHWTQISAAYEGVQELHGQLIREWKPSGSMDIVDHPVGFQLMSVPLPKEALHARLVLGPFVFSEQRASRLRTMRKGFRGAGVPDSVAKEYTEHVPSLDRRDIHHIAELMEILSKEAGHHATENQAPTRRLEERRKPSPMRSSNIIGESGPMVELFQTMDRLTNSESTVYIQGENGTGKELVAHEVYANSPRAGKVFLVQNCSALNDNLLESELFGHIQGSFTGAIADKPGLFNAADGGTLFLDEIGEMSPALQVKLLRVVQEGTFTAVGDVASQQVDVRILCATNRDLRKMVSEGLFREDLYYRINVINLRIPPLRERSDDIPLLIDYFLTRAAEKAAPSSSRGRAPKAGPGGRKRLSHDALACLIDYDWPGNVRELENEIERLIVLSGSMINTIDQDLLSPRIRYRPLPDPVMTGVKTDLSLPEALEAMERAMIIEHLKRCRWNKTKTAQALGVSRRNLIRKVNKYGLDRRQS